MEFIPLAKPDIRAEDIEEVKAVLTSGMLVQGVKVAELEHNFGAFVKSAHAIAASNGTATLHLALLALGIGKGDEVIVPAFSFVATANVVEVVGALPVFVDIDPETFNIDVNKIEEAITKKTRAIIPVHEFGLACDIEAVMRIAKARGLAVIEDAACAMGAWQNNKMAGTFGDLGSFSLHPRKAITSGEGGIVVTTDENLDRKIRILRNHGIEMQNNKTEFVEAGLNYRLTDFQAALVNSQLKRLQRTLNYRAELAQKYFELIKNPLVKLPFIPSDRNHTWQTFHVVLNDAIDRDQTIATLRSENIGTNYGAQCIPFQQYYKKKYGLDCQQDYPHAMRAYNQGLALPMHEQLRPHDIAYIAEQLNKIGHGR